MHFKSASSPEIRGNNFLSETPVACLCFSLLKWKGKYNLSFPPFRDDLFKWSICQPQ